jgi:hypothetical protein
MNNNATPEDRVLEKITDQSDAIDLIADELTFLLLEAQKNDPPPESPLAIELAGKFLSLYEDFKRVRERSEKLASELDVMEFKNETLGMVYKATAQLLVRKLGEGLFAQFICVVEHGRLPDDAPFEEEN